jgi:hypothetical protein
LRDRQNIVGAADHAPTSRATAAWPRSEQDPTDCLQPKLQPSARSLLDRGLMRLDAGSRTPRLFFTDAGLIELRAMMADRRLADPMKFAHIRQELGNDPT